MIKVVVSTAAAMFATINETFYISQTLSILSSKGEDKPPTT